MVRAKHKEKVFKVYSKAYIKALERIEKDRERLNRNPSATIDPRVSDILLPLTNFS